MELVSYFSWFFNVDVRFRFFVIGISLLSKFRYILMLILSQPVGFGLHLNSLGVR